MRRARGAIAYLREHSEASIGVMILLLAVSGSYVTWQAAKVSGTASGFAQQARSAEVLKNYYGGRDRALVAYETRVASNYRARVELADSLEADARRLSGERRTELLDAAREERAVARSLQLLFQVGEPVIDNPPRPGYDRVTTERFLYEIDENRRRYQPRRLEATADEAREKRLWLVIVDTVLIAAIFFLTLAQLAPRLRREFAIPGLVLAVLGWSGLLYVQLFVEVAGA